MNVAYLYLSLSLLLACSLFIRGHHSGVKDAYLTLEKYIIWSVFTRHTMGSFRLQKALIFLHDFLKYSVQDKASPELETGTNNFNLLIKLNWDLLGQMVICMEWHTLYRNQNIS